MACLVLLCTKIQKLALSPVSLWFDEGMHPWPESCLALSFPGVTSRAQDVCLSFLEIWTMPSGCTEFPKGNTLVPTECHLQDMQTSFSTSSPAKNAGPGVTLTLLGLQSKACHRISLKKKTSTCSTVQSTSDSETSQKASSKTSTAFKMESAIWAWNTVWDLPDWMAYTQPGTALPLLLLRWGLPFNQGISKQFTAWGQWLQPPRCTCWR